MSPLVPPYTGDEPKSFEEDMYWRGAVVLAYWRKAGCLAYVCLEHHDVELPYCLLLGIKPDGIYQTEPGDAREWPIARESDG